MKVLPPGTKLGPYVLGPAIGSGATAQVYRARAADGTLVALKHMARSTPETRARFQAEVDALRRISHPGCVDVHDAGEQDGRPWLAMEYVEGEPLDDRVLRRTGADRQAEILRLGIDLAEALDAVHDAGILHHDLKPANVLVTAEGRAVLVDFGFAGAVDRPVEARLAGTLRYMAPERLSDAPTDLRADLFSLGVVLFELLARRPPHVEEDRSRLILAQCTEPAPSIREFAPELPAAASEIIDRLLAKAIGDRPRSAREVVDALRTARGEPRQEGSWRPVLLTSRYVGRRSLLAELIAAVQANDGQTLLLHGPGGIGLSRTLQELQGRVLVQGGRPVRLAGGARFLFRVLDGLAGPLRPSSTRRSLLGDDRELLLAAWPDLARPTEDLVALSQVPTPADLARAVRSVLRRAAQDAPLLLTVDDAELTDPRDLRLVQGIGTLVLASHHPAEVEVQARALALRPLGDKELAEVASGAIGPTGPRLVAEHGPEIDGSPGRLLDLARGWALDDPPVARAPATPDSAVASVRPWEHAVRAAEAALADRSPRDVLGALPPEATPPPPELACRAAMVQSRAAMQAGDPDAAAEHAARAAALAATPGERSEARLAELQARLRTGDHDAIVDAAEGAADEARHMGEEDLVVRWEVLRARALYRAGRLGEAWDALAPWRSPLPTSARAGLGVLWNSAQVAVARCDWTHARAQLLSAREVASEAAGRRVRAGLRAEVGHLWLRRGAVEKAQTQLARAHHDLAPTGDRELLALVRSRLAEARLLGGDVDEAGRLAAAAVETARSAHSELALPAALRVALRHARVTGDRPRLGRLADEVTAALDARVPSPWFASLLAQLALARFELGERQAAPGLLSRAEALGCEDPHDRILVRLARHAIEAREGTLDPADAHALVRDAEAARLDHVARVTLGFTVRWTASAQVRAIPQVIRRARAAGDLYGACWLGVALERNPRLLRKARVLGYVAMAAGRAMPA